MPASNDRRWRLSLSDFDRVFRRDGTVFSTSEYFVPTHVQQALSEQDIHIGKIEMTKRKKWNHEQ